MIVFLTILVSLLSAVFCFLTVHFLVNRVEEKQTRVMITVVISLVTAILMILTIFAGFVPGKSSKALKGGIEYLETSLESASPGMTNEVLDKDGLKEILFSTKDMRSTIARNSGSSLLASLISANAYVKALELFADSADSYLLEFEASGKQFTLHNILEYTQVQLQAAIRTAVKVALFVFFILSLLCNAAVSLFATAIFKKWIDD